MESHGFGNIAAQGQTDLSPVLGWDLGALLAPPTPAELKQESWGSGASRREGSLRFTAKTKFPLNRPLLAQSKNPFS